MRRGVLINCLAFSLAGCFQDPAPPPDEKNQAYFLGVERDWLRVPADQRSAFLNRILADDFVGFTPDGHMRGKASAIAFYSSVVDNHPRKLNYVRYGHFGYNVVVHGQTTAAATPAPTRRVFMRVWTYRYGKWLIIASEDVELNSATNHTYPSH